VARLFANLLDVRVLESLEDDGEIRMTDIVRRGDALLPPP
jgi:hypothetical protein